jgi:hypothetical protein
MIGYSGGTAITVIIAVGVDNHGHAPKNTFVDGADTPVG